MALVWNPKTRRLENDPSVEYFDKPVGPSDPNYDFGSTNFNAGNFGSGNSSGGIPLPPIRPNEAGGGFADSAKSFMDSLFPSESTVIGRMNDANAGSGASMWDIIRDIVFRGFVIILGFIFIAAGLYMFGHENQTQIIKNLKN